MQAAIDFAQIFQSVFTSGYPLFLLIFLIVLWGIDYLLFSTDQYRRWNIAESTLKLGYRSGAVALVLASVFIAWSSGKARIVDDLNHSLAGCRSETACRKIEQAIARFGGEIDRKSGLLIY